MTNLDTIMAKVYKDFLIYKYLGKLNKDNIKLPEEVIITVCNSYLKNKSGIKDKWAWFMITAKECWKNYNASHNIKEHWLDVMEELKIRQVKSIR